MFPTLSHLTVIFSRRSVCACAQMRVARAVPTRLRYGYLQKGQVGGLPIFCSST